jgi:hypothetical protein
MMPAFILFARKPLCVTATHSLGAIVVIGWMALAVRDLAFLPDRTADNSSSLFKSANPI